MHKYTCYPAGQAHRAITICDETAWEARNEYVFGYSPSTNVSDVEAIRQDYMTPDELERFGLAKPASPLSSWDREAAHATERRSRLNGPEAAAEAERWNRQNGYGAAELGSLLRKSLHPSGF